MRYRYISAPAALLLSASLMAQVPGESPTAPAIPGTATPSIVLGPQAAGVILPTSMATAMGNSNNIYGVAYRNQRYQQCFTGSQVGTAKVVTGHSLRTRRTDTGPTQTLEHRLSMTTMTPGTITATFATNITSAQTIVFTSKSYKYPNMVANTTPTKFDIQFKYDKPFVWTGAKGQNLLLETRNSSTASGSYYVDANSGDVNVTRVYATGTTATTGTVGRNYGITVRLDSGAISNPGTYVKFGAGCKGTGGSSGIILPAAGRTAMGNSNNIFGVAFGMQRYQQIHNGAEVGTAKVFLGHSLRMRSATYTGPTQTLEHRLSHTSVATAAMNVAFATNITGAQTIVFTSKAYKYPNMVPNTTPSKCDINFKYDKPFVWTGAKGQNLLLETRNSSAASGGYYVDAFSGNTNVSRLWYNGNTTNATGTLGLNFGIVVRMNGAGGGSAVPVLSNTGVPSVGNAMTITLSQAKANSAAGLWLSASKTKWGPFNLPLSLTPFGAPGCLLLVSPTGAAATATNASGDGSVILNVPNVATLKGVIFHNQFFVLDGGANSLGLAFTNGGTGTIGG